MKLVHCPKGQSCDLFSRSIEVTAQTREIVDTGLKLVEVEDPREMRLVRRFSGVWCIVHRVQAVISITGS